MKLRLRRRTTFFHKKIVRGGGQVFYLYGHYQTMSVQPRACPPVLDRLTPTLTVVIVRGQAVPITQQCGLGFQWDERKGESFDRFLEDAWSMVVARGRRSGMHVRPRQATFAQRADEIYRVEMGFACAFWAYE